MSKQCIIFELNIKIEKLTTDVRGGSGVDAPPPNFFQTIFHQHLPFSSKPQGGLLTPHPPLSHFSLFKIFHAGFRARKLFKGNLFVKQEKLQPFQQNLSRKACYSFTRASYASVTSFSLGRFPVLPVFEHGDPSRKSP